MADETKKAPEATAPAEQPEERRIMCYVSKEMVPVSATVEVDYTPGKPFRVLAKYVKYSQAS